MAHAKDVMGQVVQVCNPNSGPVLITIQQIIALSYAQPVEVFLVMDQMELLLRLIQQIAYVQQVSVLCIFKEYLLL